MTGNLRCGGMCNNYTSSEPCNYCKRWDDMSDEQKAEEQQLLAQHDSYSDKYDPDAILADRNSHPKHVVVATINKRIRDEGEHWAKCANCGDLYQVTGGIGGTVCSPECEKDFSDSLREPF